MTGKTHQIIGITSGLAYFCLSTSPEYSPATLGVIIVGSHLAALLPDLDKASSSIWDNISMGHIAGKVTDPFIKHRNISHSLLGFVIFYFLARFILLSFPDYWGINYSLTIISIMIAYGSHLLIDMITVQGIPLLFPSRYMFGIPPKPFEGIRIITGKWFENLIIFPLANIALIILIWTNWQTLHSALFK